MNNILVSYHDVIIANEIMNKCCVFLPFDKSQSFTIEIQLFDDKEIEYKISTTNITIKYLNIPDSINEVALLISTIVAGIREKHEMFTLHSVVVSKANTCFLLLGQAWSGKSILSIYLHHFHQYSVLSTNYSLINIVGNSLMFLGGTTLTAIRNTPEEIHSTHKLLSLTGSNLKPYPIDIQTPNITKKIDYVISMIPWENHIFDHIGKHSKYIELFNSASRIHQTSIIHSTTTYITPSLETPLTINKRFQALSQTDTPAYILGGHLEEKANALNTLTDFTIVK